VEKPGVPTHTEVCARSLHPATRSGKRLGALDSAVAAQNPTHTAVRGITAVDASTTTHAEVRAATTAAATRKTSATTRAATTAAATATTRAATTQQQQPERQQRPQREQRQQQQPDPPQQQQGDSWATFVAEGVRWRQQTVVWTWPEGPAEETAATEERESGRRVVPG